MLFSVIVPVYNVEKYLDICVESVLSQTIEDFELILIDDGSTDKSGQMCDEYSKKDSRVKVIHKENSGASGARNLGIDNASGDYVMFLDSDDFWNRDDSLKLLAEKINLQNSDIVIFGCTDWNMNTNETVVSRSGYDLDLINKGDVKESLHYLLSKKMLPGGPTIFTVKRSIVEDSQIRFHLGIQDEDYDFVLNIFNSCKHISAIDEPFYTYRKGREGSITGSSNIKMIYGIEYTINKWLPICEKMKDEVLTRDFLNYIAFVYTTGFVVCGRMNKENRQKALKIMDKYKSVLKYGYWKKTKITRYAVNLIGSKLFSILAAKYFDKTHIF